MSMYLFKYTKFDFYFINIILTVSTNHIQYIPLKFEVHYKCPLSTSIFHLKLAFTLSTLFLSDYMSHKSDVFRWNVFAQLVACTTEVHGDLPLLRSMTSVGCRFYSRVNKQHLPADI